MKGIKYIAPFTNHSGYGEASRNYILALHRAGVPVTTELRSFEPNPPPVGTPAERKILNELHGKDIDYDVVVVHLTPDLAPAYKAKHPGKHVVSLTVWETSRLHPVWVDSLNQMDEVWVPCEWNIKAFKESGVKVPIYKVPHGINPNTYDNVDGFWVNGLEHTTFVFGTVFQWNARKNPEGLLRAYYNAFTKDDDVALVMKAYVGRGLTRDQEREYIGKWVKEVQRDMNLPNLPKLFLLTDTFSTEKMKAFYNYCDAYVSLTRGEGFGLPMFEAGLAGKPVIATGMGGNMEFMNRDNSYCVPYQWTFVNDMSTFNPWYLGNQQWAEPNQVEAAKLMRGVRANPGEAARRGADLKQNIKDNFSWDKVVLPIIQRLEEINGS